MPFRDAYLHVKKHLEELQDMDPHEAIALKTSLGATAGLPFGDMESRIAGAHDWVKAEQVACGKAISKLLGVSYPLRG